MKAPFSRFGNKDAVAPEVWRRFGSVSNYVEPFAGSAAVLLMRPDGPKGMETINDADGFISNFFRAVAAEPEEVLRWAQWPVNEADLHARHLWLVGQSENILNRLMGDPHWYDAKIAGWWVWGSLSWIGRGWCIGKGPWVSIDGVFQARPKGDVRPGVRRTVPHLTYKRVGKITLDHFQMLSERLREVRVVCGDWTRLLGAGLKTAKINALFLDPPYGRGTDQLYPTGASLSDEAGIAAAVWDWAVQHGDDPALRIAVAGYDDGRVLPEGWAQWNWAGTSRQSNTGYSNAGGQGTKNLTLETLWFSPHCLQPDNNSILDLLQCPE